MLDASRTIAPHALSPEVRKRRDAAIDALNALELSDFAEVLSAAGDKASEAGAELDAAWQDKSAGNGWHVVAAAFDKLAGQFLPFSR